MNKLISSITLLALLMPSEVLMRRAELMSLRSHHKYQKIDNTDIVPSQDENQSDDKDGGDLIDKFKDVFDNKDDQDTDEDRPYEEEIEDQEDVEDEYDKEHEEKEQEEQEEKEECNCSEHQKDDEFFFDSQEFVQGFLYGAFQHIYDISKCYKDADFKENLDLAMGFLQQQTYENERFGLRELGRAMYKISESIKGCKDLKREYEDIKHYSDSFIYPQIFEYKPGQHHLSINNNDIYPWITVGMQVYPRDPLPAGQNFGLAGKMGSEGFQSRKSDEEIKSYEFLAGFIELDPNSYSITNEDVFNNINGISSDFLGYIDKAFTNPDNLARPYIAMDELSHVFMEGAQELQDKNCITEHSKNKLQDVGRCLSDMKEGDIEGELADIFTKALEFQKTDDYYQLGQQISQFSQIVCIAQGQHEKQRNHWFNGGNLFAKFLQQE